MSDSLTIGSERLARALENRKFPSKPTPRIDNVALVIEADPGVKALVEAVQWAITDIAKGEQAVAYLRAALRKWEHGDV